MSDAIEGEPLWTWAGVKDAFSDEGRMSDVRIRTLEPFEVHPISLAKHLLATTPRWRWLRRRRLRREIQRLRSG